MTRIFAIAILLVGMTVGLRAQSAQTAEEEASSVFDVVMIWTVCQTLSGETELEAMKKAQVVMGKVAVAYLEKKPAVMHEMAKLLPEGGKRYEAQFKFMRTLSGDNRREVCRGVNETVRPFVPK